MLKVSITLVLAHTNRSFTGHGIADAQCAKIVTHFATSREFLCVRVALDYKVDVTFVVNWRDGGVRAANYCFAFLRWLAEKLDMISHGHTNNPLWVRELQTYKDGVMRYVIDLRDCQFELVILVLLSELTDCLGTLRISKECCWVNTSSFDHFITNLITVFL